jgi:hypothetical protein
MDILWPALGISAIVVVVLYALAGHWGRLLRQQSMAIRHLSDRLQMVEEVDNPRFRELVSESAPVPLEQVLTFSFRFSDRFWRDTLCLPEADWNFVRSFGSFVGSVKLERWRSHTVATITEVLPDRKTAAWQKRSLDYYPGSAGRTESLTLWELPLARPNSDRETPSLELVLRGNAMELAAHVAGLPLGAGAGESNLSDEILFFRTPLDLARLAEFRGHDPAEHSNGNGASNGGVTNSWRTFYSWENEDLGIEWQLRVLDLTHKIDWERWKVLESATPQITSGS